MKEINDFRVQDRKTKASEIIEKLTSERDEEHSIAEGRGRKDGRRRKMMTENSVKKRIDTSKQTGKDEEMKREETTGSTRICFIKNKKQTEQIGKRDE